MGVSRDTLGPKIAWFSFPLPRLQTVDAFLQACVFPGISATRSNCLYADARKVLRVLLMGHLLPHLLFSITMALQYTFLMIISRNFPALNVFLNFKFFEVILAITSLALWISDSNLISRELSLILSALNTCR